MKTTVVALAGALALSGCASIFNGSTQSIVLNSVPEGATVSVTNRAGEKVHTGDTPATVTLKRGAGYFKSESYRIVFSKVGYSDKEVNISGTVHGWYFGNILLGGLIGMLAVDPATGAMYSFPDSVTGTLDASAKTSQAAPSLTVVSTESLSADVLKRGQLVAVVK